MSTLSNYGTDSIGVVVEVEVVALAVLLALFKSLDQGLPLGLAHLQLRDDVIDIDAFVDKCDLLGGVLLAGVRP